MKPPKSNTVRRKSKTYYRLLKLKSYNERILDNLKKRTVIDIATNCWLWQGGKSSHFGHGKTSFHDRTITIHRLAMHLIKGFDLMSDNHILHKLICPNRNCWNPEHLYEGNHQDNMNDRKQAGNYSRKNTSA